MTAKSKNAVWAGMLVVGAAIAGYLIFGSPGGVANNDIAELDLSKEEQPEAPMRRVATPEPASDDEPITQDTVVATPSSANPELLPENERQIDQAPDVIAALDADITAPDDQQSRTEALGAQTPPETVASIDNANAVLPQTQLPDQTANVPVEEDRITVETAPDPDTALGEAPVGPKDDTVASLPAPSETPLVFSATTLTLQATQPPDAAANLDAITPRFDLVRVDPNGTTLVAGIAEPNVTVTIISSGEVLAETQTNASGEFVAFLAAPIAAPEPVNIAEGLKQANPVSTQAQVVILPNQENPDSVAPVVVLATQDKVEVIQPSGLSVPDNVSLDSISYDIDGNVVLVGRGAPGRMARIYANDAFQGAAQIGVSGSWDVALAGLEAGRYVLRVDEILPDGTVSSRVESPFQREFPEALALSEFAQGAKVIVQPGNTLWLMATQAYGNGDFYTQIFSANQDAIRDPDLIYPGQVFSIPNVEE